MDAVLGRVGIYFLCSLLAAPMGEALVGVLLIQAPNATDGQSPHIGWVVLVSALWFVGLALVVWNPLSRDGSTASR